MEDMKTVFNLVVSDIKDYIVNEFEDINEELLRKGTIPSVLIFKLQIENVNFSYIDYNPFKIVFYAICELEETDELEKYLENLNDLEDSYTVMNAIDIFREKITNKLNEHFNNNVYVLID